MRFAGLFRHLKCTLLLGVSWLLLPFEQAAAQAVPGTCPAELATAEIIRHDLSASCGELCGIGTVRLEVQNPFNPGDNVDISEIVVTEDLGASGLTYVPSSTSFSGTNISVPPAVEPSVNGPNGSVLTWTISDALVLEGRQGGGSRETLHIEFDVTRAASLDDEGLIAADRTIQASVEFLPICDSPALTVEVDSVVYVLGGPELSNAGNNWTLDLSSITPLAEGTYEVTANATDAAGNPVTDGSSNELVIDSAAPSAPVVNALLTNDTTPILTGMFDSTGSVSLTVEVDSVVYVLGGPELSNAGNNWTLDLSSITPLAESTYEVTAIATDAAGNPMTDGSSNELVIDSTTPSAPVVNALLTNDTTPILTGMFDSAEHAPTTRFTSSTLPEILPLKEPELTVIKTGRNVDAGQDAGSYSDPIFGHENDDLIWRIEVRNDGGADLQDLVFDESMDPGNFVIDYVCDDEGDATGAATGGGTGACVAYPAVTSIPDVTVADLFGTGPGPYIAAPAGGSGFYYLVGRVTNSCLDRTNTVDGVEWGCEIDTPPGGIFQTSTGQSVATATAELSTSAWSNPQLLDVAVALTGTNTTQPMGSKGTVTITLTNNAGGTIKGGGTSCAGNATCAEGIRLHDVLPAEYVIDPTFTPTVIMEPAYGNAYPGMVDSITWTNPTPNTFPLTTTDPTVPLLNTDLEFVLWSSTEHPDFGDQFNMIRNGDVVTVTFRTILIDPTYYDKTAYIDLREEMPGSDPPNTDPTETFAISNFLEIEFEEFCTATLHNLQFTDNDQAEPEDIDVDIVGSELVFILTSTGDPLPITVAVTNHGGHDADDYFAYVTIGEAMVVQTVPGGCTATSNPPLHEVWQDPVTIPASASVYVCDAGLLSPNETQLLNFEVVKNTAPSFDDDLTFRADVIGEITLTDGTPLWFPDPTPRGDSVTDRANNYTIDALWARVIGYNLNKTQLGICSENNPPPGSPDAEVQIGEECSFDIESGGWFGFQTPGFTYIAVQNIQVVDPLPDGQAFISSTNPLIESTSAIAGVSFNPPPAPLDEGTFDWTFNTVVPSERILEKDHWFRVDVTTRLLNDPIDTSASPNEHTDISTNILTSTFEGVWFNDLSGMEEVHLLSPSTVGFPREVHRRVDLTVTEPHLTVIKEVCNETLYGTGPACTNFSTFIDDGDAYDSYINRVTVTNEASAGGVPRAPAYEVTVTSVTDASDLVYVIPLDADGLDNDGNTAIDEAAGEGQIVPDNVTQSGGPAEVVAAYTHSTALERIDPGTSVVLYYRIDPDDDVAPLQLLTNSVSASYDSLEGASGNQTAPLGANGEIGGARQYVSESAEATIQILSVEVVPKQITQLANSAPIAGSGPQPVTIGEELEFELRTFIPVAQLRNFVIRDELPAGMRCAEAPVVDLGAPPYSTAGFVPGGVITPTCTDTLVAWDFGDQTVTQSPGGDPRFDFAIRFIAQIDNVLTNQDGLVITNGGASTVANASYIDQLGTPVVLSFEAAEVIVRESVIEIAKSFTATGVDGGDVVSVTVTATNTGTATAYNLRVLDDLSGGHFSYAGQVGGANPPPNVDVTSFGPNSPGFSWNAGFGIDPGESISFSFAVLVDGAVEPHEILANTIQADWTSLPGIGTALNSSGQIGADGSATGMRNGTLPNAGDALNDYEAESSADVTVPPPTMSKTDLDPALVPEIGVHKPFQIDILLPEGTTVDVAAVDDLDVGTSSYVFVDNSDFDVTYQFIGIQSVNGQPPSESAFNAFPVDGGTGTVSWDIGTVVTVTEDDLAGSALDPTIRINYYARINNDLATDAGSTLQNSVDLTYVNGETGAQESINATTSAITAIESSLAATKALSNVTPGKAASDPLELGDILEYVVTIVNSGTANAYDINIVDTLPVELAHYSGFTPTATINGVPVPGFVGIPAGAPDSPLFWGRNNGDDSLDLGPGGFLELTYQVVVRAPAVDTTPLANNVWIDWTSLAGPSSYERTGVGCPVITLPNDYCYGPALAAGTPVPLDPPEALLKENTQATAAIGEEFSYRITVPSVPYTVWLYDVRIFDDLSASAADLSLVSVAKISGSEPWTPVNTGTPTDLILEDTVDGIDIPAGEQIVVEVTVVLDDTATNVAGLAFMNTASYTYDRFDGDPASQLPGETGTTPSMTIVEPDVLEFEKSGPTQMRTGMPATFNLNLHNASDGSAWGLTITDQLPNDASGGMCDAPPSQFTAQVFEADGVTPVSAALAEGTDFSVSFNGDPDCSFTIGLVSAPGVIAPGQRLIVTYQASLDADSQQAATLTNVAGATEWFSVDVSDPVLADRARTYTRTLTDGTVGVLDHEDAHTLLVQLPVLLFEKTIVNVTTGQDPGLLATPGETLRYRLRVENLIDMDLDNLSLVDEFDSLNANPAFAPGTLNVITIPAGADAGNSSGSGGANGTGMLDIRNMSLSGIGDSLLVEYEVTLAPVIANGSYVLNQARLESQGFPLAQSDDPNVNGPADPDIGGDEDPTQILIESAPEFDIDKVSAYVSGDPSVLLAGETLRYMITVKNTGTDNATDAVLTDQVPANTTYIPASTMLNGVAVADDPGGGSPLSAGLSIHAPEDATPGAMRANASATQSNIATIVFDVLVNANVVDGTIISNQAFVSAIAGGIVDRPSDDPRTPVIDDPTRDIVGGLPLLFSEKFVALNIDAGSAGIVDPGDTLRYTITVYNDGRTSATDVTLTDFVPTDTAYVADSLTLNGLPVGQPDGGVFPLAAGIPISSGDLTPPLPAGGAGTITAGNATVIEFDLRVDDGVPPGTLIINQALVNSEELPAQLTDGDGNPATGPEPTVVVVGDVARLSITKQVSVIGGGGAVPGATLEYVVRAVNIGAAPAFFVVLTDDLDAPVAGQLTFVDQSWTMDGSANGIAVAGFVLTADYSALNGPLEPGESTTLRFRAVIDENLTSGTTVTNTAVVTWNTPAQMASVSVSVDVGGTPGSGILNGTTWHDANFDDALDATERLLEGWTVELFRNDQVIHTTLTDTTGVYQISGIAPNDATTDRYEVRFRAPGAGLNTAALGEAYSADFTNDLQRISDIVIASGNNLLNLDLPIDPNGVVYDSIRRTPISGAILTLSQASSGTPLPSSCFDDPAQQNQVTPADGFYKFDINFSGTACPSGSSYVINVTAPFSGYVAGYSQIIPPSSTVSILPFNVPACPGSTNDALSVTAAHCEVQPSEFAPPTSVLAQSAGTSYHVHLTLDGNLPPGSSQIFNNHIPLDPELDDAIAITKRTPAINVTRGQLVPYIITINNELGFELMDVTVIDRFPAGFRYIEGSARLDGVPTEPLVNGRELAWTGLDVTVSGQHTIQLLLGIGAGVSEGEFVNRAMVINGFSGNALSGEASATVRLVPDPMFDCTDVMGKVFDDRNRDGLQDLDERGIGGVRLVTARGLTATTDSFGRFHITCAITPHEGRGSNFVLKIDDRTLPSGFRASTDMVQVQRATRGKALNFNFGASIHRVVGLDIADPVFAPDSIEMRPQWRPRLLLLLEELEKAPATLRLWYLADIEDPQLVDDRLNAVRNEITDAWEALNCCYDLEIEEEVFWRLGAPSDQSIRRRRR